MSFVEPGFVDVGFIDDSIVGLTPNQHWTDFREFRRGRLPSEEFAELWTQGSASRIEGALYSHQHKNVFRASGTAAATQCMLSWLPPSQDPGYENQELLACFRPTTSITAGRSLFGLRAGGALGAENAYRAAFDFTPGASSVTLVKRLAGANTTLGTASIDLHVYGYYWIRFRAYGTAISLKVWADGTSEPGSWSIAPVTDALSGITSGALGIYAIALSEAIEVRYLSAGTNGLSAPSPDQSITEPAFADSPSLYRPFELWVNNPEEQFELTARVEFYNPDTDTVESRWYSSLGRVTKSTDYPPTTPMYPFLAELGTMASTLEADAQFGGLSIPGQYELRFHNTPQKNFEAGLLSWWRELSFHGRPVEIRIGKRWLTRPTPTSDGVVMPHRRFEILSCVVAATDPDIKPEGVTLPVVAPQRLTMEDRRRVGPAGALLNDRLPAYTNIGIAIGIKALSASGYLLIPSHTAYELTAFTVSFRMLIPVAGVAGSGVAILSRRETDATHRQWFLGLGQASSADAHKLILQSWTGGGVQIIGITTSTSYNVNRFVDVVLGINGNLEWYLNAEGMHIGGGTLSALSTTAAGANVDVNRSATGIVIVDHRIESYLPEDEAVARFAARREPDAMTISMHRCDDNTLSTVTDYSTLANHGTLQGTDAVDRAWAPTYLGFADLAGTSMPISGGVLYHAPTAPIDANREIFRYNDRAKTTGAAVEVRARALSIAGGGVAYSEPADGLGTIDVVGAASEPLTFGLYASPALPEDERIHVPRLVYDELTSRGVLTPATGDGDSFYALRQSLPFRGGYYYSDPPIAADFLTNTLGPLGAFFTADRNARVAAGMLQPLVNPGPYGRGKFLEFLGLANGGVTFTDAQYANESATFTVGCIFKTFRTAQDNAASLVRTMPTGQTLIDRLSADGTYGYYLGLSGLADGSVAWGLGGVTSTTTGLKYLASPAGKVKRNRWYLALGRWEQAPTNRRSIVLVDIAAGTVEVIASEFCTSDHNNSYGLPLIIGGGPNGGLVGSICNVQVWSTAVSAVAALEQATSQVWVSSSTPSGLHFFAPLQEGRGDFCFESDAGVNIGYISGCRWCPRFTLDFTSMADLALDTARHLIPAWRTETRYRKNYAQLTPADISASVSAETRKGIQLPYLSRPFPSPKTRDSYLNSRDIILDSPLLGPTGAEIITTNHRDRINADRWAVGVNNVTPRLGLSAFLTDEIEVYHPGELGSEPLPMRAVSLAFRGIGSVDLGMWG